MADNGNETYQVPDALWEQIEPILPPEIPGHKSGCPEIDNRKAMEAILYVFRNGCGWKSLPRNLGTGSTVYRRFQ
jgi:putative transposase